VRNRQVGNAKAKRPTPPLRKGYVDKEAEDKFNQFAKEFIAERNELLARGDTEGFEQLFAFFFDNILVTSPKYQGVDLSGMRQKVLEMARDYAVKNGPDA